MIEKDFIEFCEQKEPQEVADVLNYYVQCGQECGDCEDAGTSDDCVFEYSSRAVCALAAEHCRGRYSYVDFYEVYWGGGELQE